MESVEEHSVETATAVKNTTEPQRQTLPTRSFKLRFAAQHELGRSNLSAIRPLTLPVPLADKFYARVQKEAGDEAAIERALQTVRERFARGPRELYPHPVTSAHEYGWWSERAGGAGGAPWARHHIRDSAWLRERLRLLAPDAAYKR